MAAVFWPEKIIGEWQFLLNYTIKLNIENLWCVGNISTRFANIWD
jgi:hypothetical protein